MEQSVKIIKLQEVIALTKLSKSSIYERVKLELLPPPFSMGGRSAGYYEHEVKGVLAAMAAGYSHEQLKSVVKSFIEQRKQVASELMTKLAA
jgi:prophage regulatory protein